MEHEEPVIDLREEPSVSDRMHQAAEKALETNTDEGYACYLADLGTYLAAITYEGRTTEEDLPHLSEHRAKLEHIEEAHWEARTQAGIPEGTEESQALVVLYADLFTIIDDALFPPSAEE